MLKLYAELLGSKAFARMSKRLFGKASGLPTIFPEARGM